MSPTGKDNCRSIKKGHNSVARDIDAPLDNTSKIIEISQSIGKMNPEILDQNIAMYRNQEQGWKLSGLMSEKNSYIAIADGMKAGGDANKALKQLQRGFSKIAKPLEKTGKAVEKIVYFSKASEIISRMSQQQTTDGVDENLAELVALTVVSGVDTGSWAAIRSLCYTYPQAGFLLAAANAKYGDFFKDQLREQLQHNMKIAISASRPGFDRVCRGMATTEELDNLMSGLGTGKESILFDEEVREACVQNSYLSEEPEIDPFDLTSTGREPLNSDYKVADESKAKPGGLPKDNSGFPGAPTATATETPSIIEATNKYLHSSDATEVASAPGYYNLRQPRPVPRDSKFEVDVRFSKRHPRPYTKSEREAAKRAARQGLSVSAKEDFFSKAHKKNQNWFQCHPESFQKKIKMERNKLSNLKKQREEFVIKRDDVIDRIGGKNPGFIDLVKRGGAKLSEVASQYQIKIDKCDLEIQSHERILADTEKIIDSKGLPEAEIDHYKLAIAEHEKYLEKQRAKNFQGLRGTTKKKRQIEADLKILRTNLELIEKEIRAAKSKPLTFPQGIMQQHPKETWQTSILGGGEVEKPRFAYLPKGANAPFKKFKSTLGVLDREVSIPLGRNRPSITVPTNIFVNTPPTELARRARIVMDMRSLPSYREHHIMAQAGERIVMQGGLTTEQAIILNFGLFVAKTLFDIGIFMAKVAAFLAFIAGKKIVYKAIGYDEYREVKEKEFPEALARLKKIPAQLDGIWNRDPSVHNLYQMLFVMNRESMYVRDELQRFMHIYHEIDMLILDIKSKIAAEGEIAQEMIAKRMELIDEYTAESKLAYEVQKKFAVLGKFFGEMSISLTAICEKIDNRNFCASFAALIEDLKNGKVLDSIDDDLACKYTNRLMKLLAVDSIEVIPTGEKLELLEDIYIISFVKSLLKPVIYGYGLELPDDLHDDLSGLFDSFVKVANEYHNLAEDYDNSWRITKWASSNLAARKKVYDETKELLLDRLRGINLHLYAHSFYLEQLMSVGNATVERDKKNQIIACAYKKRRRKKNISIQEIIPILRHTQRLPAFQGEELWLASGIVQRMLYPASTEVSVLASSIIILLYGRQNYGWVHTESFSDIPLATVSDDIFNAELPDEERTFNFEEHFILPDGNCGFTAIGATREQVKQVLLTLATNQQDREALFEEIYTAILLNELSVPDRYGKNLLRTLKRVQKAYDKNSNESNTVALNRAEHDMRTYCTTINMFNHYVDALGQQLWLGYDSMILYARETNINIYVWHKESDVTNNLSLIKCYREAQQPANEIHILHTAGFTHFNILSESTSEQFCNEDCQGLETDFFRQKNGNESMRKKRKQSDVGEISTKKMKI